MKNIVIISSSLRKNSNSQILAKEFEKGAKESGNNVEFISLEQKSICFCKGCLACQKLKRCVINDDAIEIAQKVKNADVIVFATPVYYYSISGQLKTLFDRMNSIYDSDYKFTDVYLLATAAEDEETTVEGSVKAVQGWIDCFERAKLSGVVFAGNVNDGGDVIGHAAIADAYNAGKNV